MKRLILTISLIALVSCVFFLSIYKVSGTNFEIGIKNKSYVVADKYFYKKAGLKTKDIVVFISETSGVNMFGRVIAVPGDAIIYADDALLVNNKMVDLKYLNPSMSINYPTRTGTLAENQYLVVQAQNNVFAIKQVGLDKIIGRLLFIK